MKKYYNLGFFPTPLEKLENLSKDFENYTIYIKRDDQTGLATGGNKTRKLEYLIQAAIDENCETIVSAGAQQSNHCRQTAAAAAKAGLGCYLLIGGTEPENYEGNLMLNKLLGAKMHFTNDNRKGEDLRNFSKKLEQKGLKPYVIPYGGSNKIGALGYVRAVQELKQQLDSTDTEIDYIFFASSSGGTHSGLILGKELYNLKAEILGVCIDKNEIEGKTLRNFILDMINDSTKELNINKNFIADDIKLLEGYDYPGYGVVTENERTAIQLLAQKEGILLDPVYTGRAFFGMISHLEKKIIPPNSNILFWHTGGVPANFYYSKELM
jgi:D-cysteine desulfhydrase